MLGGLRCCLCTWPRPTNVFACHGQTTGGNPQPPAEVSHALVYHLIPPLNLIGDQITWGLSTFGPSPLLSVKKKDQYPIMGTFFPSTVHHSLYIYLYYKLNTIRLWSRSIHDGVMKVEGPDRRRRYESFVVLIGLRVSST